MPKESPRKKRVSDHAFLIQLFFDYTSIKKNKGDSENKKTYINKVYGKIARLKSLLETLQMIRIMVAEIHPSALQATNLTIKATSLLRYHVENYF